MKTYFSLIVGFLLMMGSLSHAEGVTGMQAFVSHGLSTAGGRTIGGKGAKAGATYKSGWAKGLTKDQAKAKAIQMWHALTPDQKAIWEKKAAEMSPDMLAIEDEPSGSGGRVVTPPPQQPGLDYRQEREMEEMKRKSEEVEKLKREIEEMKRKERLNR